MHFSVGTRVTIFLSKNGKESVYKTGSSNSTALSRKTSSWNHTLKCVGIQRAKLSLEGECQHITQPGNGRYGHKAWSVLHKCCETCTDPKTIELLTVLPGEWDPIIEDEVHVLIRSCPRYNTIREKLKKKTAELLEKDIASIFSAEHAKETGIFIKRLSDERFDTNNLSN